MLTYHLSSETDIIVYPLFVYLLVEGFKLIASLDLGFNHPAIILCCTDHSFPSRSKVHLNLNAWPGNTVGKLSFRCSNIP